MNNKVELHKDYVIKYNTSKFSTGVEKLTESLSVNHRREIRVYEAFDSKKNEHLKIPTLIEMNNKFIKIQRLYNNNLEVNTNIEEKIPYFVEFLNLGKSVKKMPFFDLISSPGFSFIRGSIYGIRNYGFSLILKCYIDAMHLTFIKKTYKKTFLIHKDLKWNQNTIQTDNGLYFFDFGSSVLTKRYFLTDIVGLSIDLDNLKFDIVPIVKLLKILGFDSHYFKYAKMQIRVLLMRNFIHLHPNTKKDNNYMLKVTEFIKKIDNFLVPFDTYQ